MRFGTPPGHQRNGWNPLARYSEDQFGGDTAKAAEGIFQTPDELLSILTPEHFAVAFARVAQDDPQQMRTASAARVVHNPGSLTEIHLRLFPGRNFPPAKRQFAHQAQTTDESFDRSVVACEGATRDQILIDALRGQTLFHGRFNRAPVRLALAASTGDGAGVQNGRG